jgi:tellurium resistance protein TerZ
MASLPSVPNKATVQIQVSWDSGSAKPVDVDLQVCVFDSLGLMLDACFFNNLSAAEGSLVHSGDSRDGVAAGVDEMVTVKLPLVPPHAFAIVAGVYCTTGGTLNETKNVKVAVVDAPTQKPIATHQLEDLSKDTSGMIVCMLTRVNATTWAVSMENHGFKPPCRNFADALKPMQELLNVDPTMQAELKALQPVYSLKKDDARPLPLGLSKVAFGLGWDAGCDVDGSVVALGPNGTHVASVYFCNRSDCDGAIVHSGDNVTGEGDGDDETITLDLDRIPSTITHCFLTINVFTAGKDFRNVKGEFVRIYDARPGGATIMRYGSLDSHGSNNGVVLGCLARDKNIPSRWGFRAISLGAKGRMCTDLVDECQALQAGGLPDKQDEKKEDSCCIVA